LFQAVAASVYPMTQHLMEECDLTLATGGKPMVKAAYSSGRPAYGVGAGNSSIVIDETADIDIAAANTRISKTSDFGSGCSADGNIIIQKSVYGDGRRPAGRGRLSVQLPRKKALLEAQCGTKRATGPSRPSPASHSKRRMWQASKCQRTASS
jgi:sulfoacetaldehyde dehydrogenase